MGPENTNTPVPGANEAAGGFLAKRPAPLGMQRFLAKKGINSPEELNSRVQGYAPRIRWRRPL